MVTCGAEGATEARKRGVKRDSEWTHAHGRRRLAEGFSPMGKTDEAYPQIPQGTNK